MQSPTIHQPIELDLSEVDDLPPHPPRLTLSASEPVYQHKYDLEQGGGGGKKVKGESNDGHETSRGRAASDPLIQTNTSKNKNKSIFVDFFNFIPTRPPILSRKTSVPVFYCTICLENHPVSNSVSTSSCSLPHCYCRESIKMFAESIINEGGIQIRCPGYGECQGIFNDQELKNICEEDIYAKFIRFREVKQNPHYRECPFCNFSTIGDETTPEIVCQQCSQKYCYFHANAHPNIPCHRYTKEQLQTQMKSMALIRTMTRNCPECYTPTEKNGGCNHMTCQHCHAVILSFVLFSPFLLSFRFLIDFYQLFFFLLFLFL